MFTWTMVEIIVASWVCSFSVLCLELPESACAVSLRTVGVISRCPRNKYEYDVASTRKNCSQYNATGCLELHYHCVLNENATGLVELEDARHSATMFRALEIATYETVPIQILLVHNITIQLTPICMLFVTMWWKVMWKIMNERHKQRFPIY
ncbi:uncharacterized protein LOC125654537 isoform X1 [Ostrea edulis]|uniref:uncharacterized protein LOC125654537 isoform X1 n=1 Tax=Ostrea edulis TaxID=37623 RepID=UPI0024AF0A8A|nr:uncharacterized protein LOC125654537 isoform X1 [Ostrea edulis]